MRFVTTFDLMFDSDRENESLVVRWDDALMTGNMSGRVQSFSYPIRSAIGCPVDSFAESAAIL